MARIWGTLIFALTCLCLVELTHADSWPLPTRQTFESQNGRFQVEIEPRPLESQLAYFAGLVGGREQAGARPGSEGTGPIGRFGVRRVFGYEIRTEFPLVNDVSPVQAIVDDRGERIVTFDNWHMAGYGDDVVVIYTSTGKVLNQYGLDDLLTVDDLESLPRSISSIQWRASDRIDEATRQLVLSVGGQGVDTEPGSRVPREIRIDLVTGKRLGVKRSLWPHPRFSVLMAPGLARGADVTVPSVEIARCISPDTSFASPGIVSVPSDALERQAIGRRLPVYGPVARLLKLRGAVAVDVLIDAAGQVTCARVASGVALLGVHAVDAALQWTFDRVVVPDGARFAAGQLAFEFDFEWQ